MNSRLARQEMMLRLGCVSRPDWIYRTAVFVIRTYGGVGGGRPRGPSLSRLEIAISPPMNEFFLAALSFGLAAGLKPGPLGVMVIQQALSRGLLAGVQAGLAPLITDGPIIIAALWCLSQFKSIELFAAALSLAGGAYLLWLSAKMFRVNDISLTES
jgi:hypothetical protein